MKIFVYALREYDELYYLKRICEELNIEYDYTTQYPNDDNLCYVKGYDAISIITNPMTPDVLDKLYSYGVRYISTRSVGYDHIDVGYAKKIGMKICHTTYSPNAVADYTIMMMLMSLRKVDYICKCAKKKDFSLKGKIGRDITNSSIGIVGSGAIGERVIRHLSGFGCKVYAYDLYKKDDLSNLVEYVDLDTLYEKSDIISLHLPLTKDNYHMINSESISKMKDNVIIINASRGGLVDTYALIHGLNSGKVSFAALDTFEGEKGMCYLDLSENMEENPEFSLLKNMDNVMLSPHMAFYTENSVKEMVENSIKGLILCEGNENPFEV